MIIYDANGAQLLNIEVDDTSVRYKAIKGDNSLTLRFSLAEHIEVPIGSWCEFKGETYSLMAPSHISMHHRRNFEYSLLMYGDEAKAKRFMFINPVDGRLKFTLSAFPKEHLQMFVDNMNMREPEGKKDWKVGECIEHERITLSYNMTYCYDALVQLANQLELDYWFDGKNVYLGKLEVNKNEPLPLSYGGDGQGLKPGIKRTNYSDALPIEILYVKGSEENIDFSKYGSNELHLPMSASLGYDGFHFSDEEGFDESAARWYVVDSNGYSIRRSDKIQTTLAEDSLDCSEITPTKEEIVDRVDIVDEEKHFYDIYFTSDVDYKQYQIAGETAYIAFQTGQLAGKQFDLATTSKGTIICEKVGDSSWRVELKPQEIDGIMMPDHAKFFGPYDGDSFKVFGIQLPEEYISNPTKRSGAEWDMLRYAIKHLFVNEVAQYTISGELDEIFAKRNWSWISEKIVLGGYVSFSDKSFQEEPILIRITGIKEYVNKPYSPQLELTNQSIGGTVVGTINRIENQEVYNEQLYRNSINFTKRRYRDAQETSSLLQQALLSSFSDAISPITIKTMQTIVGDEALQFQFVESKSNPNVFTPTISYGKLTQKVTAPGCWIQHMTLGINGVSNTHAIDEYRFWKVKEFESQITEIDKPYYLYVKADWNNEEAEFDLRPAPIAMDAEKGVCYYFLVGILNKEIEGERSFVSLYGFTEILPGQISTDVIRSSEGNLSIDLVNAVIDAKKGATIKGSVKIEEGSMLSSLLAVGEEGTDNVDAFLNGSDDFSDEDHGKLILAGGVPSGDGTLAERSKDAKTRIYEDGHIVSSSAEIEGTVIAKSGKIADFDISGTRIGVANNGTTKGMFLTSGYIGFRDNTTREGDSGNYKRFSAIGENVNTSYQANCQAKFEIETTDSYQVDYGEAIGVHSSVKGYKNPYAFYCPNGQFAGLRPKVRRITSTSKTTLSEFDHTILCVRSDGGTINIELPKEKENGQCYEIWKWGNCGLTLTAANNIARLGVTSDVTQGVGTNWSGIIKLIYSADDAAWLMTLHKTE